MARMGKLVVCNPSPRINKKDVILTKLDKLVKKVEKKRLGKKQLERIEKFIDGLLLTMDL